MVNLEDIFKELHENPPNPFNPGYKSYAKHIRNETYKSLEAEGWYEKYTLKQRQESNLFRIRYDELMLKYES